MNPHPVTKWVTLQPMLCPFRPLLQHCSHYTLCAYTSASLRTPFFLLPPSFVTAVLEPCSTVCMQTFKTGHESSAIFLKKKTKLVCAPSSLTTNRSANDQSDKWGDLSFWEKKKYAQKRSLISSRSSLFPREKWADKVVQSNWITSHLWPISCNNCNQHLIIHFSLQIVLMCRSLQRYSLLYVTVSHNKLQIDFHSISAYHFN